MNILVTSTSFQDNEGEHKNLLEKTFTSVDYLRGPLSEEELLKVQWNKYDGVVCGDDEYSSTVLKELEQANVKVLSKYGVGLDKVDLNAAKAREIKVVNCLGINHETVAEHVFALLLSYAKNIPYSFKETGAGRWSRKTGFDLKQKSLLILGLGKIGKEVAKRAKAFNIRVSFYDPYVASCEGMNKVESLRDLFLFDIISIHVPLNESTRNLLNVENLKTSKDLILVNTSRAHIVNKSGLESLLNTGEIRAYLTDVWYEEPCLEDDPLLRLENIFITPHIASRTIDNVEKQGLMSVHNLIKELNI